MSIYRHFKRFAEQSIYDLLVCGIENYDTEIAIPDCDAQTIKKAVECVRLDSHSVLSNRYSVMSSARGTCVLLEYLLSKDEYKELEATALSRIEKLVKKLHMNTSDYEKELLIHDYLIENTTYSLTANNLIRTHIGVLSTGYGVCEGIAKAAKYLFDIAGIQSAVISGSGFRGGTANSWESHSWNIVRIDGDWYHLDITFDLGLSKDMKRYDYFNLADKEILHDHRINTETGVECCGITNNYYFKNGLYLPKKSDFANLLNWSYTNNLACVQVRLPHKDDSDAVYSKVCEIAKEFLKKHQELKGYYISHNKKQMVFALRFY